MEQPMTDLTPPKNLTEVTPIDLVTSPEVTIDSYQELREQLQILFDEFWSISVKCIYIPEAYRTTFILWVFLTHMKDYLNFAPLLVLDAYTRGCGKSTLQQFLAVMCGLVPEDRYTDFTKAGLKQISGDTPVFLDEIDSITKANLRNVTNYLNTSFEANGAQSINAHTSGSVFGFRCISGIGALDKLAPATQSRSIRLLLKQTPSNKKLEMQFHELPFKHIYGLVEELQNTLSMNAEKLQYYFSYVEYPQQAVLLNRFGDAWRNLFDLATLLGEKYVNHLMACVQDQDHLDDAVQFPKVQYFVNVQQYNEPEKPQFYDGTDDVSTDYSTIDFLSGLKAVLTFHESKASTGVQTKELFAYITQLKIKDAPPTQRTLGRYMTDLEFKINKNIHKSSGYRYDETLAILTDKYSKSVNDVRYQQYLTQLQSA